MMLERQREGIAKAKAEGKYKGRKPTARVKADDAVKLYKEGKRIAHIAKSLGIGRGSVYRALMTRKCDDGRGLPAWVSYFVSNNQKRSPPLFQKRGLKPQRLLGRTLPNVRFTPKADIYRTPCHVRFTPKADIYRTPCDVRFVPIADIPVRSHTTLVIVTGFPTAR